MGFASLKFKHTFFVLLACVLLSSCTEEKFLFVFNRTSVKNVPIDTAFVYSTKINIIGKNVSSSTKTDLTTALQGYIDDSLNALRAQRFGVFYRIKNPPIFDTINISRSIKFMNGYLNSVGYYHTHFNDSFYIDTVGKQQRTTIEINIDPGKVTLIDSVGYDLTNKALQRIATLETTKKASLLIPNKSPFSKPLIGSELDRLVALYKNRGYLLISRDNLLAEADTTDASLLKISVDPFEQISTMDQAAEKRKDNPLASVTIKTREINNDSTDLVDSAQIKQYRVGHIYFYPEVSLTQLPDSVMKSPPPVLYEDSIYTMYGRRKLFNFKPMREHQFMQHGLLYRERQYAKTINNLSIIGAWQNVDTRTVFKAKDTVDFHFFMVPAEKENVTVGLEASRNSGDLLTTGTLIGLAINATYVNRNVWHRAIQSNTSFRNGVELSLNKDNPLLQTFQSTLSQTYSFPNLIFPFNLLPTSDNLDAVKTILAASGTYSERKDYFRIRSAIGNWGAEFKKRNKLIQIKFPNIELYSLDTLPKLVEQLQQNAFLRTAFNTGSIVSIIGSFTTSWKPDNHPGQNNFFRVSAESAGSLTVPFRSLNDKLYQYIKVETEFRKLFSFPTTSFATRVFAGMGYNYGSVGITLPFYKQFVAGGPNSMRAWSLRQLGLGSSLLSDTAGTKGNAFRDRFGDFQLEANLEYRYRIAEFSSLKLGGALFADIGNIWNIKKDDSNPNSEFNLNRLGKDIAIGIGTGIRFDFNYFLIRIDGGLKLKDPAREANNGWMDFKNFTWKNYEYERKLPDGTVVSPNRNNFAIQLGIGLPF